MVEAIILVVDDDEGFRAYVRAALESAGFRVIEEADAAAVVATALEHRPDVILLDWRMPGQSGITTCRALRAQPSLAEVPIAMVTGLDDERDRTLARHAGADAFLLKSGDPDVLFDQVRRLLASEDERAASSG